jgi:hypothetical protein
LRSTRTAAPPVNLGVRLFPLNIGEWVFMISLRKIAIFLGIFVLMANSNAWAQHEDLEAFDFSPIWQSKDEYLGYIGDNYQRLYIRFETMKKISPTVYHATGQTKVKENIFTFSGVISNVKITDIADREDGDDDIVRKGIVEANFTFVENAKQKGSGIFRGTLLSYWGIYKDKGRLEYYQMAGDGDHNNQFSGTWTSNATTTVKKCAWGNYRVPNRGDFDVGVAEFSVNPKYVKNGWESYHTCMWGKESGVLTNADENDENEMKYKEKVTQACKKENEKWWKQPGGLGKR